MERLKEEKQEANEQYIGTEAASQSNTTGNFLGFCLTPSLLDKAQPI